jgi:hypothetical protein
VRNVAWKFVWNGGIGQEISLDEKIGRSIWGFLIRPTQDQVRDSKARFVMVYRKILFTVPAWNDTLGQFIVERLRKCALEIGPEYDDLLQQPQPEDWMAAITSIGSAIRKVRYDIAAEIENNEARILNSGTRGWSIFESDMLSQSDIPSIESIVNSTATTMGTTQTIDTLASMDLASRAHPWWLPEPDEVKRLTNAPPGSLPYNSNADGKEGSIANIESSPVYRPESIKRHDSVMSRSDRGSVEPETAPNEVCTRKISCAGSISSSGLGDATPNWKSAPSKWSYSGSQSLSTRSGFSSGSICV